MSSSPIYIRLSLEVTCIWHVAIYNIIMIFEIQLLFHAILCLDNMRTLIIVPLNKCFRIIILSATRLTSLHSSVQANLRKLCALAHINQ